MAITNLTGYTWVSNDDIDLISFGVDVNYDLLIEGIEDNTFDKQLFVDIVDDYYMLTFPKNIPDDDIPTTYTFNIAYYEGTWDNGIGKMHILGGTDATNSRLISWLEANGTLTPPEPAIENKKNMYVGGNKVSKVMVGDKTVSKILIGDKVIYEDEVETQGETWLINEKPHVDQDLYFAFNVNFTSNDESFNDCKIDGSLEFSHGSGLFFDNIEVYTYQEYPYTSSWSNHAYRTITFEEAPTGELLTWLQANAVKQ